MERVLYDDENGTDLLIDEKHNVNLVVDGLSFPSTHRDRNNQPMAVMYHDEFQTYYVEVIR